MIAFRVLTLLLFSYKTVSALHVSGKIQTDTVWRKTDNPHYVIGNIEVPKDITLTIQSGVNIVFPDDFEIVIKGGFLKVLGTLKDPVSFLSMIPGTRWMLTFEGCDLTHSLINSAQFTGCKPAVQLAFNKHGKTQNEGTLVLKDGLFMDGVQIGSNGPIDYDSSMDSSPWQSALVLQNVGIYNSKLTTNYGKHQQPIHLIDSYIENSTFIIVDYKPAVLFRSCYIKNTNIEIMFESRLSTLAIEDTILNNVDIAANVNFYKTNGLLLIRRSVFRYGSIFGDLTGVNILIDDSTLLYVDIQSVKKSFGYQHGVFILQNSIFHHGSISTMDHQSNLIGSDINLDKSPIEMGDNSKILCTSITRKAKTNLNTIGIDASSITIKDSTIHNFQIGIRVTDKSTIASSNIYQNLLYNIENRGSNNIRAQNNWWGTSIEMNINSKIHDYYDGLPFLGKVIYSDYSPIRIEPTNSNCSNYVAETTTYPTTITSPTPYIITTISTNAYYTSKSSINYTNLVIVYCMFIFLVRFF